MTFEGEATKSSTRTMKILVVVLIIWVAYWATNGGLEQIAVPENAGSMAVGTAYEFIDIT